MNFNYNFTEIFLHGFNWQYSSICPDIGLVPNRKQVIIWTNNGLVWWCIYASLSLNELKDTSMRLQEYMTSFTTLQKNCFVPLNLNSFVWTKLSPMYMMLGNRVLGYWLLLWFRSRSVPLADMTGHLAAHRDTSTMVGVSEHCSSTGKVYGTNEN